MSCKRAILLVVPMVALCLAPPPSARAAEDLPAAEKWIPAQAAIVVKITRPKDLLGLLLRPELVQAVEESTLYKVQAAKPGFRQFRNVVQAFERRLGADWQTILRKLLAGGATLAVGPNGGSLLIVDAADANTPKEMHGFLMQMVRGGAKKEGRGDPVSTTKHGGVTTWALGPNQVHAILGKRWLISNRPGVLKMALDLRDGQGGESLAALPAYRQAAKAVAPDAAAMVYVNAGALKKLPGVAKALDTGANPLAALLASPLTEALSKSTWLAVSLKVKGQTLTLSAVADGAASGTGAARFALPAKGGGALPNLAVPGRIAAMSLHRDLRGFYAAKDKLFPERTSGLIFFENMMGIFFTGRDLTEEVLAEMGSKVRLVVAEQKYDPAIGTPAVRLPAFALIVPLKNPKKFSLVVEEAWQKAIGLINFTRGQQAEPGLIIDRPVFQGTKYTVATFIPAEGMDKKALDIRYNFRPALAMPGKHLILSSTDYLAEDIMAALAKEDTEPPKPLAGVHSLLEIEGPPLTSILQANLANLIRQNMIDKGNTREQARGEVGVLLEILKHFHGARLTFGTDKGRSEITLQIRLNLPAGKSGGK